MSEHTKEPWRVMGPCAQWETARIFTGSRYIGSIGNIDETESETRANADRIVSCVNACARMNDPATDISTLKAQRDELLAAAKAYQELSVCYRLNKRPTEKLFDRLETANFAIASAEARPCD